MLKVCGALINFNKQEMRPKYQIFPTLNAMTTLNFYNWFHMRCCLMEFGKKYMYRIFFYTSTFLSFYLIYLVLILLDFFKIADFKFNTCFFMIGVYDVIVCFSIIIAMLHYGAMINELF